MNVLNGKDVCVSLSCVPEFHWTADTQYQVKPLLFSIDSHNPLIRKFRFLLAQLLNPFRFLKQADGDQADVFAHLQYQPSQLCFLA